MKNEKILKENEYLSQINKLSEVLESKNKEIFDIKFDQNIKSPEKKYIDERSIE